MSNIVKRLRRHPWVREINTETLLNDAADEIEAKDETINHQADEIEKLSERAAMYKQQRDNTCVTLSERVEQIQQLRKELLFEHNANEEKGRRIEELEQQLAYAEEQLEGPEQ